MKNLKSLTAVALTAALTILAACQKSEDQTDQTGGSGGSTVSASLNSSDPSFTATTGGGTIDVDAYGGSVIVNVDCNADWAASYKGLYWINASADVSSGTLTVTVDANPDSESRTGTVTIVASSSGVELAAVTVNQEAYGTPEFTLSSTSWNAPAVGTLSTEIAVTTDISWKVSSTSEAWITAQKSDDAVSIAVYANPYTESRSGYVTLTADDGVTEMDYTIEVTQDGLADISISSDTVNLSEEGGSASVTVEANLPWSYSYDNSEGWLSVTVDEGTLTVTASANSDSSSRTAVVSIVASDGAENTAEAQLTVNQYCVSPMILQFTASSAKLPITGDVNCTVDWGDGTVQTVTSSFPSHSYSEKGTYEVTITGTVTAMNAKSAGYAFDSSLTGIVQWGRTGLTDMTNALYYCWGITSLPADTEGSFSEVTSFEGAFLSCTYLTSVSPDLFAYAEKAENFNQTFCQCNNYFTEIPEGLFDHCVNAVTFAETFKKASKLATIPAGLFDKCLKATTFTETFNNCYTYAGESPYSTLADGTKVHLYERSAYADQLGCVVPEEYSQCFYAVTKMTDYNAADEAGWVN